MRLFLLTSFYPQCKTHKEKSYPLLELSLIDRLMSGFREKKCPYEDVCYLTHLTACPLPWLLQQKCDVTREASFDQQLPRPTTHFLFYPSPPTHGHTPAPCGELSRRHRPFSGVLGLAIPLHQCTRRGCLSCNQPRRLWEGDAHPHQEERGEASGRATC